MRSNLMLLLAAAIWGLGFVAQRQGMNFIEPFAFNGVRFLLGGLSLLPLIAWLARGKPAAVDAGPGRLWRASLAAGSLLFVAATLQQVGLLHTTAAKAGFITGLYLILVPILGLLLRQNSSGNTWLGAGLALVGLYLLSINEALQMSYGDSLQLIGALFWAIHILVIHHYSARVDPLRLAAGQFGVCALLSFAVSGLLETPSLAAVLAGWRPILYAGLIGVGVAYTLQVVGQRHAHPTHAAIILSLESVFAALGGSWLLGEQLSLRAWSGCALMLAGMLLSQLRRSPPAAQPTMKTESANQGGSDASASR